MTAAAEAFERDVVPLNVHDGDFNAQVLQDLQYLRNRYRGIEEALSKLTEQHAGVEQAIQSLRVDVVQGGTTEAYQSSGNQATNPMSSTNVVAATRFRGLLQLGGSPLPQSPSRRMLGYPIGYTEQDKWVTPIQSSRSRPSSNSIGHAHSTNGHVQFEESVRRDSFASADPEELPPTLPQNWPMGIRMRNVGRTDRPTRATVGAHGIQSQRSQIMDFSKNTWVLDPNSLKRLVVDLIGFIMLLYDMTCLPYLLAWEVEMVGLHFVVYWISTVYWTFDLILNFFTAYMKEGEVVRDSVKDVARHYLFTLFVPDLLLAMVGWISLLGDMIALSADPEEDGASRQVKVLRLAKMSRGLRIFALLRLFRLTRFLEEQVERSLSESTRLALRIACVFFGVVWTTHLVACGWYAVGVRMVTDTSMRWPEASFPGGQTYAELPTQFQYFSAYHWAMTQMTLGGSDMIPRTTYERIYSVVALMLGLLCSLTLVSSTSTAMIEWKIQKQEQKEKIKILRKYLRQQGVDSKLALRVQRQVMSRIHPRHRLTDAEVPALQLLSTPLRQELMFSVFRPQLTKNLIMHLFDELDPSTLRKVCDMAASSRFVMNEDPVFEALTPAEGTFVVTKGLISYIQDPDSAPVESYQAEEVEEGAWLCEAALWSEWLHVGTAEALTHSNVICVNAEQWALALQTSLCMPLARFLKAYGQLYHERLKASCPPRSAWPSDLGVPNTSWWELLMRLGVETQELLSVCCLDKWNMRQQNWMLSNSRGYTQLREEVSRGSSMLLLGDKGQLERFVSISLLQVCTVDDAMLVEVMRWEDDLPFPQNTRFLSGRKHVCRLPGAKQERGEKLHDTIERIVNGKLAPLKDYLDFKESIPPPEVTSADENTNDVHTKYFRTICHATLSNAQANERASADLKMEVEKRSVYVDGKNGGSRYYSWMTEEEYQLLSSKQGEPVLREWLNLIEAAIRGSESAVYIHDMTELVGGAPVSTRRTSLSRLSDGSRGSFSSQIIAEVEDGTATHGTVFECDTDGGGGPVRINGHSPKHAISPGGAPWTSSKGTSLDACVEEEEVHWMAET